MGDNCSTPAVKEAVDHCASPRIRYLRSDKLLSMVDNWNLAIGESRGEYVTIIGSDDGMMPYALREAGPPDWADTGEGGHLVPSRLYLADGRLPGRCQLPDGAPGTPSLLGQFAGTDCCRAPDREVHLDPAEHLPRADSPEFDPTHSGPGLERSSPPCSPTPIPPSPSATWPRTTSPAACR